EKWFWAVPFIFFVFVLTSNFHQLFFETYEIVDVGQYAILENTYGPVFFVHAVYSYLLLISGVLFLGISLTMDFKRYGAQAYGLIIGVLAPLIGNVYYLFGSPPPGFPDPTPIIFTVTGVSFAWAIFGGHLLEVVPLAHDVIVQKLSTGIVILDLEKNVRDINPAAIEMLGLAAKTYIGEPLSMLLKRYSVIAEMVLPVLDNPLDNGSGLQVTLPETGRSFDVLLSRIEDDLGTMTGWLLQFSDVSEQKQAEADLASTRETLESVLDTLQDSYFESDLSGVIRYANLAFCNSIGFSREEVIGKHFRHFTFRETLRDIYQKFNQVIATQNPLGPFEYTYRTKDGNLYVAETIVSPIIEDGVVVGTRGLMRDITDRLKAEREILEQKHLLDSLLQQSPIAMVINNKQGKIRTVNPAFEKLFGYVQNEVLGKDLDAFLATPETLEDMREITLLGMKKQTFRMGQRKKKDGSMVDVEVFSAPLFVGGEQAGHLVFYHDISERLKAEAEREETQLTYRAVLDSLQDVYFEADREGFITYANQAFVKAVAYASREELIGKHFRHVASRKSIRSVYENFNNLYETQKALEPFEFIYRNAEGVEFASEMVVSPIFDDIGSAIGTRGIVRDISVRVKAEEILRQAKEAAEHRAGEMAVINRIAETVSRSLDLEDILQSVCVELTKIFPIRNAGIGLLGADKESLEIVAFHASEPEEKSALGMVLPFEGNPSSQEVIEKKTTVVVQDAQNDPRMSSLADISRSRGTKAIMIVPLLTRGEAIGTIGMPARDPEHVFTSNEIELAETIASQIAAAIDNARLYTKTELALDVAERDLEIGRQIQSGFFPENLPRIPGWEVAAHFHAARQVAGDFYDSFQFRDSNLTAFIIADVCDKGVGAALFMVLFRSLLRAFSERPVDCDNVREQLLDIVLSTNNFIAEYHGRSNMFATLFFGILDPDSGVLYYVNGGHEPPVVMDKDGAIICRLMPTGPAVGMFPDLEFRVEQIQMDKGDLLVGFTDGATDAKNSAGELFSEERLLKSISAPWTSIFSMFFELNTELHKHIGKQNQFDDITLISFRRKFVVERDQHAICRVARLEALGELCDFAEGAANYSGLSHDDVFAFKLAAEELCANIIQYGYEGTDPGLISMFFDLEGNV
ncbi:MAG: PAS domain S-box protein, partial [Anaerolineales bacterium]